MFHKKAKILTFLLLLSCILLKSQDTNELLNIKRKPVDVFICIKESFYLPKTNKYIYFFPNTSILVGININSSSSFFSIGPSFTQDISMFYGFNVNYRYVNGFGVSPNNFLFNCGYKYLHSEYIETYNNNYYNHKFNFNTFYLGIGYKRFLGKDQIFYLAPMINLSLNFIRDNLQTTATLLPNNPRGYYEVKLDGLVAPILEFEIGLRLNRIKTKV